MGTSCTCDIANYWPGIHNTALFDIFADMSEQNCFHNFAVCTQNFSKTQKETFSIFSTSLSCKHP